MNQTIQFTKDDKIRRCLDRIADRRCHVFQLNGDGTSAKNSPPGLSKSARPSLSWAAVCEFVWSSRTMQLPM